MLCVPDGRNGFAKEHVKNRNIIMEVPMICISKNSRMNCIIQMLSDHVLSSCLQEKYNYKIISADYPIVLLTTNLVYFLSTFNEMRPKTEIIFKLNILPTIISNFNILKLPINKEQNKFRIFIII